MFNSIRSKTKVKISIIIPTYNAVVTLENCLESIIRQTYADFEILLIDGISTDDTVKIISKYATLYPFISFISERDLGIYDAMNKGINLCSGEWVYFLGSDDTLYNNEVLALIADAIDKTEADVIYGNVLMRGENQWNLNNVIFNGEYNLAKLLEMTINHQAIFYKKSVFKECGLYNLKYKVCADYDFNLRCYALNPFQYVNIIIANFFVGGKSTNFTDDTFHTVRGALYYRYYKKRIFNKSFINARLYLHRAALLKSSPLNAYERFFCLAAYIKLKLQSAFI